MTWSFYIALAVLCPGTHYIVHLTLRLEHLTLKLTEIYLPLPPKCGD